MAEKEQKEQIVTPPVNWREMTDKDFLSADYFEDGEEKIFTIRAVRSEKLINEVKHTEDTKPVLYFEETDLKLALNKTNAETIEELYKTSRVDLWVGKKIQIFKTTTKAFGSSTTCLRIRNFVPEFKCSVCGKEIDEDLYRGSIAKYGKPYCSKECLDKDTKGEQLL